MTLGGRIYSVQPWRPEFGDPADPGVVLGAAVRSCLLRRPGASEVLVLLADRRYALTGSTLIVGSARQLAYYIRQRAARSSSAAERTWLGAAADILACRSPEPPSSVEETTGS